MHVLKPNRNADFVGEKTGLLHARAKPQLALDQYTKQLTSSISLWRHGTSQHACSTSALNEMAGVGKTRWRVSWSTEGRPFLFVGLPHPGLQATLHFFLAFFFVFFSFFLGLFRLHDGMSSRFQGPQRCAAGCGRFMSGRAGRWQVHGRCGAMVVFPPSFGCRHAVLP